MPDHMHVLALGDSDTSRLESFVALFKQLTGFDYKQRTGRNLWQTSYYDRVLRSDEDTRTVARYVLANPIRAGLATGIDEYPYAESDEFDVREI
jgi:putative transposase